jgi:hypothetical protein
MLGLLNLGLSFPLQLAISGSDRTRHGKPFELQIAVVAEEVIAEDGL